MAIELRRRELLVGAVAMALLGPGCKSASRPATALPHASLDSELKRLRKRVKRYVVDQDRRYRALALVEEGAALLASLDLVLLEWREAMVLAPEDQRRDRAWLLAVTETFNRKIADVLREAARVGVALRQPIHADEWPKVFRGPAGQRAVAAQEPPACSP